MKKILVVTGGGDCPGLNAVIRGLSKSAEKAGGWQVWGSLEAFNGCFCNPPDLVLLDSAAVAGIHVKGGTIIKTTNKNSPAAYPVKQPDGTWLKIDRTQELADKIANMGFDAVVNIGGDGSQKISQALFEKGVPIIGVPKTIDNDLSATDYTFGFLTAVQIATDSFDKLVTTAESHHRVMLMEVMGRDAGWIALHTAVAGGAEICLIPEIPYRVELVAERILQRMINGKGFVNIVVAEGAKPLGGEVVGEKPVAGGSQHIRLGGIANFLKMQLEELPSFENIDIRTTVLGHVQRGGTPIAFDRILASAMGVKAFELVQEGAFGRMVSFHNNNIDSVLIADAVKENKFITPGHYLMRVARSLGISFGDSTEKG